MAWARLPSPEPGAKGRAGRGCASARCAGPVPGLVSAPLLACACPWRSAHNHRVDRRRGPAGARPPPPTPAPASSGPAGAPGAGHARWREAELDVPPHRASDLTTLPSALAPDGERRRDAGQAQNLAEREKGPGIGGLNPSLPPPVALRKRCKY